MSSTAAPSALARAIYLDHAATSLPKPPEVLAAIGEALSTAGNPGRGGHRFAVASERLIDEARRAVARLIGEPEPRRVLFTLNGTDALNIAIHGVVDAAGSSGSVPHVVTTSLEHNSITRPLNELRDAGRIRLSVIDPSADGVLDPATVAAATERGTALVAVTMASNALGTMQPASAIVQAVRARSDALVLLDAAQVVGAVPLEVNALGADLLAAPGHKAMLGPMGTGVLWVGPRAMPSLSGDGARIAPFRSGGTGGDSRLPHMPPELPHRLEAGTPNVVGIAGLGAGVRWVMARGVEAIRDHERGLVALALDGLAGIPAVRIVGPAGADARVGAVSFVLGDLDPVDLATILEASFAIAMRAGLHCAPGAHRAVGTFPAGSLRLSVGPTTTREEIERAVDAVRQVAAG